MLYQFCFHKTLFVQSFLIFQYLEGTVLSLLVIVAFEHDTKATFAYFLNYFISVGQVFVDLTKILVWVRIKSIIGCLVKHTYLWLLSWHLLVITWVQFHLLPFIYWEEVDSLILKNLPAFDLPQVGAEYLESIIGCHRETLILVRCRCTVLLMAQWWHLRIY